MKRTFFLPAIFIVIIIVATGCGQAESTGQEEVLSSDGLIQLTRKQFETDGMRTGEPVMANFGGKVKCYGYITTPPNGMAQISARISGLVDAVYCLPGDYVKKGKVLCMLSTNELIVLQQDFAVTSAKLASLKAGYERVRALYDEKIGSEKEYIATESEYKAMQAKYQALKLRLQMLNLEPSKIEAGELYPRFPVIAPISGYITSLNIVLGQFVEQQTVLMDIVDVKQLQLQLSVFENDLDKLKTGQRIRFTSLGKPGTTHFAVLSSIGKSVGTASKTIPCIARIDMEEGAHHINNSYVEATIILSNREAKSLPDEAIVKSGDEYFVFVVEKSDGQSYFLRKVKVNIGSKSDGFTEIVGATAKLSDVVIGGVYNLQE
ncbi:MAG: efflux RND transporter periplasmic adaptor subunit [Bacteroidales bacterium]|nr:efflux RND transporter periplasmic adaptor subunit [Bacteroidales bacterium]